MRHEHDCETIEFQNALHAFHSLGSLFLPSPCAYLTMHTLFRHQVCLPFLGRVPTNSLFSTYLRLSLVKTRPGLLPHHAHSRIANCPFSLLSTLQVPESSMQLFCFFLLPRIRSPDQLVSSQYNASPVR